MIFNLFNQKLEYPVIINYDYNHSADRYQRTLNSNRAYAWDIEAGRISGSPQSGKVLLIYLEFNLSVLASVCWRSPHCPLWMVSGFMGSLTIKWCLLIYVKAKQQQRNNWMLYIWCQVQADCIVREEACVWVMRKTSEQGRVHLSRSRGKYCLRESKKNKACEGHVSGATGWCLM